MNNIGVIDGDSKNGNETQQLICHLEASKERSMFEQSNGWEDDWRMSYILESFKTPFFISDNQAWLTYHCDFELLIGKLWTTFDLVIKIVHLFDGDHLFLFSVLWSLSSHLFSANSRSQLFFFFFPSSSLCYFQLSRTGGVLIILALSNYVVVYSLCHAGILALAKLQPKVLDLLIMVAVRHVHAVKLSRMSNEVTNINGER